MFTVLFMSMLALLEILTELATSLNSRATSIAVVLLGTTTRNSSGKISFDVYYKHDAYICTW